MTTEQKNDLIAEQQLEIRELKKRCKENKKLSHLISMKFIAIGQPLNDNCLKFNKNQLRWCQGVLDLVEQIT